MNYQPKTNDYKKSIEDPSVVFQKILSPYFLNNQTNHQNRDVGLHYLPESDRTEFIHKMKNILNTPSPAPYVRPGFVDPTVRRDSSFFNKDTMIGKVPFTQKENKVGLYNYRENTIDSCNRYFYENSSYIPNESLNMKKTQISRTYSYKPHFLQKKPDTMYPYSSSFKSNRNITNSGKYYSYRLPFTEESSNNVYNKRSAFILSVKSHESSGSNYMNYCNNCGKSGHGFYQCKNPITSYGIIVFRYVYSPETNTKERQYLMIRRRDTISYVDFLRGKYSLYNRKYIKRLINDMTVTEQDQIMTQSFDYLWYELWKNNEPNPSDEFGKNSRNNMSSIENMSGNEKFNTRDKFNILQNGLVVNGTSHFTITDIVNEIRMEQETLKTESWSEPEWGFCKGRRNYKENDYDCAVREMEEETGYSKENMTILKNVNTFEEVFIGSNLKCYRHKYYLMYMTYENSLKTGDFEKTEVSSIKWTSIKECLSLIRSYNVEKKRMITDIDVALNKYSLFN